MKHPLILKRHYWTGGRPSGVRIHREVTLHRPDGFGVRIMLWSDPKEGVRVHCIGGISDRARRNFPSLKEGLRWAVHVANAPADLWGYGRKALIAERAL